MERARAGKAVVRLKGGDPYVFGRGGEEVLACAEAGVPVTVVPGVTSAIAVPAVAGVPVTHRAVAHEFTVVSGHVGPDSPASLVRWEALAGLRGTLVMLMGLKNLAAISATLVAHGRPADTPVAVVQEGTTSGQRMLRSTLGAVAADVTAAGHPSARDRGDRRRGARPRPARVIPREPCPAPRRETWSASCCKLDDVHGSEGARRRESSTSSGS